MVNISEILANRRTVNFRIFRCIEILNSLKDTAESEETFSREEVGALLEELENECRQIISYIIAKMTSFSAPETKGMADGNEENDYLFGHMLSLMNREISVKSCKAAMAVTLRKREPLLLVNPIFLLNENFLGDIREEHTESEIQESLRSSSSPANSYYMKKIISVLCHEMYHIFYNHLEKFQEVTKTQEEHELMNIATDCTINQFLNYLPDGCIDLDYVRERSENPDLEEFANSTIYYEALKQAQENQESDPNCECGDPEDGENESSGMGGQGGSPKSVDDMSQEEFEEMMENLANMTPEQWEELFENSRGNIDDHGVSGDEEEGSEDASTARQQILDGLIQDAHENYTEQRMSQSKHRGTISSNLQEVITRIKEKGLLNWKQLLKRKVGTLSIPFKLSKNRVNRRQPYRPELRGRVNDRTLQISVAIDTSGSMSNDVIAYALNEIYHLLKVFKLDIEIIEFDSSVQRVYNVKNPNKLQYDVHGRGGTSYQPVLDYLQSKKAKNKERLTIFLTDGGGESQLTYHNYTNFFWLLVEENQQLSVQNVKGQVMALESDKKYRTLFQGAQAE